jgi:hypothetical protein
VIEIGGHDGYRRKPGNRILDAGGEFRRLKKYGWLGLGRGAYCDDEE